MRVAEARDLYEAHFASLTARRDGQDPAWLTVLRKSAFERFQRLGFPTLRDEDWRFTPLGPIVETAFGHPGDVVVNVTPSEVDPFAVRALSGSCLVFVNGRFSTTLSSLHALPTGAVVASLRDVLATDPGLVDPYMGRCAAFESQAFTALNTALADDGAVVYLPAGSMSDTIHVVYYSSSPTPVVTFPRTLIVAGDHSQATIVESYAGAAESVYLTNAVTEIVCGEGARIRHYRVQRESLRAYHVSMTSVYLERASVFSQRNFAFGGAITRNDVQAKLDAEGIECTLDGLYLGQGDRLTSNFTAIDHAKPHCASHELYKGMLDGRSRGVFNGKIFVKQDAQKTDAKQTNQVLLLSDDATINTKPQLEIFADDVKCTHGATVGQIDEEALFYLRARGIGEMQARAMLVHAFAGDIIDRVSLPPLRDALEETLLAYLAESHLPGASDGAIA